MTATAVYRLYDATDALLYVGASRNLRFRFRDHSRSKSWWPDVVRKDLTWYPTKVEAAAAELEAIRTEQPRYNILSRRAPYIKTAAPTEDFDESLLREIGAELKACRAAIKADMKEGAALTREAAAAGIPESKITRLLGVDRMTVRKWLGKRVDNQYARKLGE